ncbi:MAG: metallophosphatase family protein [Heliobacteriaceae bacterium]|jgi:putative phosphoesterase|nr:metallophosphatase family protein [Heliobacteriaceae bacterium]
MKIAVISDIHGNFQALESVLEDIKKNNCDKIFCLGDLALAGPEPAKVVDFLMHETRPANVSGSPAASCLEIIQGNCDKFIGDYSSAVFERVKEKFPAMANALADDVLVLSSAQKEYLKNLPPQKELEIEGVKILLVHGSPRDNNEDILPDMPLEVVEEMLEGTNADVIFCGHTHIPCGYQTGKKQTVVNTGSVGRPMTQARACYVIADFKNGGFSVEHRLVDYDKELAAKLLEARNFKGSKEIAGLILNPVSRHV